MKVNLLVEKQISAEIMEDGDVICAVRAIGDTAHIRAGACHLCVPLKALYEALCLLKQEMEKGE